MNEEDKKVKDEMVREIFDALESDLAISKGSTMKKFNAGDLSKKPKQVFDAARSDGAIIQHKDRQGNVVEEFAILNKKDV